MIMNHEIIIITPIFAAFFSFIVFLVFKKRKKSARRIAVEGVEGMLNNKKVVVPTKTWKFIVFLLNIVPKKVFDFLSSFLAPGRYE